MKYRGVSKIFPTDSTELHGHALLWESFTEIFKERYQNIMAEQFQYQ
jgi:hypothetical protein